MRSVLAVVVHSLAVSCGAIMVIYGLLLSGSDTKRLSGESICLLGAHAEFDGGTGSLTVFPGIPSTCSLVVAVAAGFLSAAISVGTLRVAYAIYNGKASSIRKAKQSVPQLGVDVLSLFMAFIVFVTISTGLRKICTSFSSAAMVHLHLNNLQNCESFWLRRHGTWPILNHWYGHLFIAKVGSWLLLASCAMELVFNIINLFLNRKNLQVDAEDPK